ncbi:XdhC family protein [Streptomyces sp. NBC_01476]|uniref:XdhC family protein n=1 Tax=Streptomyces sp. NBC_01476 TaxID=2903881 RepID=UPI002E343916|nr:XdhC family protein [Streptomyces sp. NBC_01476]
MSARALELTERRVPFVHATVVRAQAPASAHAGDEAIVYDDGTIDGFVGGVCAEGSVRTAALGALRAARPLLLRVLPEGEQDFPEAPGAEVVVNTCLSGGALEIFLEPVLPPPLIEVVGHTPVAEAVLAVADVLGWATARSLPAGPVDPQTVAVVVAGHGRDEIESIRAALDAGVDRIALVASRRRGSALLDELELTAAERARISTPAGLDIGARTPPEVALSILAELVEAVRSGQVRVPAPAPDRAPAEAIDPVCGMTVTVGPDTPHAVVDGVDHWFCGSGCLNRYTKEPVG